MEISSADIQTLRHVANQLLDFVERIAGDPVVVSEAIAKMVEDKTSKRICLSCGEVTPESSKYRRGNDDACYGTLRNRIRRGEARESQLIAQGKMTPEAKAPGRSAKMDTANESPLEARLNQKLAEKRSKKSKKPG